MAEFRGEPSSYVGIMIREQGLVIRVEGRFAWIETRRRSACGSCSASDGCGTSALASLFERRARALRVSNDIGASVGQTVTVGLSEGGLLRAAFLVYMIPLLTMIGAGVLVGLAMPGNEGLTVLASLVGFGGGLLLVRRKGRRLEDDPRYQPVLLSIDG